MVLMVLVGLMVAVCFSPQFRPESASLGISQVLRWRRLTLTRATLPGVGLWYIVRRIIVQCTKY